MAVDLAAWVRLGASSLYVLVGLFLLARRPRTSAMMLWGGAYVSFGAVRMANNILGLTGVQAPWWTLSVAGIPSVVLAWMAVGLLVRGPGFGARWSRRLSVLLGIGLVLHLALVAYFWSEDRFISPGLIGRAEALEFALARLAELALVSLWVALLEGLRSGAPGKARAWLLAAFPLVGNMVQDPAAIAGLRVAAMIANEAVSLLEILALLYGLWAFVPLVWCFALMGAGKPYSRLARNLQLGLLAWSIAWTLYFGITTTGLIGAIPGALRVLSLATILYAIFYTDFLPTPLRRPQVRVGVLASLGLAALFITAQVAQNLLSDALGLLVGGVVAGAAVFAAYPLQRRAERVLDQKPHDASAPAAKYRRLVETAWKDGTLGANERLLLAEARKQLGLDAEAATQVDEDVAAQQASASKPLARRPKGRRASPKSP